MEALCHVEGGTLSHGLSDYIMTSDQNMRTWLEGVLTIGLYLDGLSSAV